MKFNVTVDCTAKEAREFFGLPDLEPMQQRLLEEVEERFRANVAALDMDTLMRTFMTGSSSGLERWQEMFGNMVRAGMGTGSRDKSD